LVNGKKMTIPSHKVCVGDTIAVREGSKVSALFTDFEERNEGGSLPHWLTFNGKNLSGECTAVPIYEPSEVLFDPELVLEYYSR